MGEAASERPADANAGCPGTSAEGAGKSSACEGCPNQRACASGVGATAAPTPETDADLAAVLARMRLVRRIVLVLSGKGGVGKSTVAAQVAQSLAADGHEVGLLDLDICGPSVPTMFALQGEEVHQSASGWSPVYVEDNLGVMSIGFLLPGADDAVVWRGPRKNGLIKQFLKDVDWGELDYLIVDTPPGTSDEHISIAQFLMGSTRGVDGALIVTTPQEVAIADVRKEVSFCRKVGIDILGVIENMSGLRAPLASLRMVDASGADATDAVADALRAAGINAGALTAEVDVFSATGGGADAMGTRMGLGVLGKIPLDPLLCRACEHGKSFIRDIRDSKDAHAGHASHARTIHALRHIVRQIVRALPVAEETADNDILPAD